MRPRPPVIRAAWPAAVAICCLAACDGGAAENRAAASAESTAAIFIPDAGAATISGVVRLAGDPPERRPVRVSAECAALHGEGMLDASVVTGEGGGLRDVFVWVRSDSPALRGQRFAPPEGEAVLDQRGCVFVPRVLALRTGQTLRIRNSDPVAHNVNAGCRTNRRFNFGQPTRRDDVLSADSRIPTFRREELSIPLRCDVHPWMKATVHVVSHPYFAVTGDDGAFRIDGLPPGGCVVEAIHDRLGLRTATVESVAGATATLEFLHGP